MLQTSLLLLKGLNKTETLIFLSVVCALFPTLFDVYFTLCCFVVYSTRRFVLCLTLCYFVLVLFSPFSIAITSLGEKRANLSAFRTFVRFVLVWICRFPLPFGVWEGQRFVIVALPGLFSYLFFLSNRSLENQRVVTAYRMETLSSFSNSLI